MKADIVLEWLRACRYLKSSNIQIDENTENELRIKLYTATHAYSIHAFSISGHRPNGYLGCMGSTRMPRAGEDHTRGNDLADGPLNKDTFDAIMADIVGYEIVDLSPKREPCTLGVGVPADGSD
jgi:hypothetical protein